MFYVFSYTPVITDTEENPHEMEIKLASGVIHQVDVVFQNGCNHQEFVRIFDAKNPLWPSNDGEKLRGNATIISFRDFYEMGRGNTKIRAHIWTTLTADFKEIIIHIGMLPRSVLQPLSFDELLKAAAGIK